MYHHILIPVDLSEKSNATIQAVRQLAVGKATTITLLHVIETLRDVPFDEMEDFYHELSEKAEQALDKWIATLVLDEFDVRKEIVYGQRSREIIRLAADQRADLIVMRSHVLDQNHLAESFGTLSHQVALLAPCSVLLVR